MVPISNPEYLGKCHLGTLLDQLYTFVFFLSFLFSFIEVHRSTPFIQSNHFIPKIRNFSFYSEEKTISFVCLYKFCGRKLVIKQCNT